MADLQDLLTALRSGHSSTAVVDGWPGTGKTALLAILDQAARSQGMAVLKARCSIIERDFPYGVVRQLLAPLLTTPDLHGPGPAGDVGTVLAGLPYRAADAGSPAVAFDTMEALCAPVLRLAVNRAVVLAVDDIQWADEHSAQWLAFLARRLGQTPVLVAVGSRGTSPASGPDLIEELMPHPACRVLQPGPLTVGGVARLLARALGTVPDEPFTETCHAMSGGNPAVLARLIRELARADVTPVAAQSAQLFAIGARVLPMAVRSSLRRHSPDVLRVAGLLGALGADTEAVVLQAAAGEEPPSVDHAMTVLEGTGLLLAGPPRRFSHRLVEESLADILSTTDRAAAHAEAARALFEARACAERIATHIVAGGRTGEPWRVEVLRRGARYASERGDEAMATRFLRHALSETASCEVRERLLVELGSAEVSTDLAACVRHLGEAEELVRDPVARAGFVPGLAQALLQLGQSRRAVELLDQAAAEISDTDPLLLPILGMRALITDGGRPGAWEALLDRGPFREAMGRTPEERGLLAALAVRSSIVLDGADHAARLAEKALQGFDPATDQLLTAVHAAGTLLRADRVDAARRWSDGLDARALDGRLPVLRAVLAATRARILHRAGELAQARHHADDALRLTDEPHPYRPYVIACAVQILLESGDVGTAELISQRLIDVPEPENWLWPYFLEARACLLVAQGQPQAALRDLEECGGLQQARWGDNPGRIAWRSRAALIEHRLKRREAAQERAARELHQARIWGAPVTTARALRVSALVGPRPAAQTRLEESVALLEAAGDPLELARSLTALGSLLSDAGRAESGREQLRRALGLAQAASAVVVAREAHEALLASGARPRRVSQLGPDSLTPSQRRVATLAAEGLSNEDIAAELFITRRTVEFHLTHAYRKLQVDGRIGLTAALRGEGHGPRPGSLPSAEAG